MKTPKEKAIELVERYSWTIRHISINGMESNKFTLSVRKKLASICVDEILEDYLEQQIGRYADGNYWQEVKQEIEKL